MILFNYKNNKQGFIHPLTFKRKLVRGFTLVEMMVAIAVFSIVMVTAMSALLNVIDANNKARGLKTAINNVSFALESITKDMRMGTDYVCGKDAGVLPTGVDPICITSGGNIIGYKSPRADKDGAGYAYYKFEGPQLWECLDESDEPCTIGGFQPITSSEVTLTNVKFFVLGVENSKDSIESGTKTQPRMIMTVNGIVKSKAKLETAFNLQTSVSQRIRQ